MGARNSIGWFMGRWASVLAIVALVLAGGSFAHADELQAPGTTHEHLAPGHGHSHGHSHGNFHDHAGTEGVHDHLGSEPAGQSAELHCGAPILFLAATPAFVLPPVAMPGSPRHPDHLTAQAGSLDPPPPRRLPAFV